MPLSTAKEAVRLWAEDGLKNIRFSGGEPTLYNGLLELVKYTKSLGVERIAISTNGSAKTEYYQHLVDAGVDDFSISLDACCSTFGDKMSGVRCGFDRIIDNIKYLSKITYVTAGVVLTDDNVKEIANIVSYAHELGVADIRIISAAQFNEVLEEAKAIPENILSAHPILKYRVGNLLNGRNVRGLKSEDTRSCYFPIDDSVIAGKYHFPCVIYMREGGNAIGEVNKNMRKERIEWSHNHNTHRDIICQENCLDVCIDYNNKCDQ